MNNQISIDRQALLDVVRALDIGANTERVPKALDALREPFFVDEITSGVARTDGSMNRYDLGQTNDDGIIPDGHVM